MIFRHFTAIFAVSLLWANAQTQSEASPATETPAPKWDVFIPEPISDGTGAQLPLNPAPVSPPVISSNTVQKQVVEPSPMDGVPPVTGKINITLQVVQAPDLPTPPPEPPAPPTTPEVQAQLQEALPTHQTSRLVFFSASVYDNSRTYLRICPNDPVGGEVTAWSNLDFNLFRSCPSYRVRNSDGSSQDVYLVMGIGDIQTAAMQNLAARTGRQYEQPTIPPLPDLAANGPAFQLIAGSEESPAMDTLEQLHDLFRKEGVRMAAEYAARQEAEAERRAELLANPSKPADVTIRYWKGKTHGKEERE